MTALLLAGVAALALGTLLALPRATVALAFPVQLVGSVALTAGAIWVLADGGTVGAQFSSTIAPRFGLDGLSALFVALVAATAAPALLSARDTTAAAPARRPLAFLTGAFVLALAALPAARDPSTFLAAWELMTLLPAAAILVAHHDAATRRVVFVYLAVTHIGGAGVWIALLVLAGHGALGGTLAPGGPEALVAVAALIGFGTKAGLAPMHAWLPRAHPVAPAYLSALMSGVMLKVALYGLIRVLFVWLHSPPWVGYALLGLGLLSALGGALYALLQGEIKRLLAFSSIENVGIIALALAAALLLDGGAASLAFGAALLHVVNHAAGKSLLFLGAGAMSDAAGRLDLERLGGLLRTMPWTAGTFLAGCAAVAALPPLNGFASEWLTLRSLVGLAGEHGLGPAVAGGAALAGLAATAGLALMAFVKAAGMALLGSPRTQAAATARDPSPATRAALVVPAAACLALAVAARPLLDVLAGLDPRPAVAPLGAGAAAGLRPVGLLVALVALTAVLALLTRRAPRPAPVPAWACGQLGHPALAWTAAGFTKTVRLALEPILRPERDVTVRTRGALTLEIEHRSRVPHLFDTLLYGPAVRWSLRGAATARRLQSGSLRLYLGYLLGLLLVLLGVLRVGLLG